VSIDVPRNIEGCRKMPSVLIIKRRQQSVIGATHDLTNHEQSPTGALAVSIAEATRISGISRSELYRRLATEQVAAVKSGKRTLILMDSLRRHLASLPPATFRSPDKQI
jgi:hypothetical protein